MHGIQQISTGCSLVLVFAQLNCFVGLIVYLLDRRACVGATGAVRSVADHARLVRAKHALSGYTQRNGRRGNSVIKRGSQSITRVSKDIASFGSGGEDLVQKAGTCRSCRARRSPTE